MIGNEFVNCDTYNQTILKKLVIDLKLRRYKRKFVISELKVLYHKLDQISNVSNLNSNMSIKGVKLLLLCERK